MLAVVWHYWAAVLIMLLVVVPTIVALSAGYLKKVQSIRYPKD
jgi:hypothetical protein